jgi:uncharacterized protein (TIGR00251 family)
VRAPWNRDFWGKNEGWVETVARPPLSPRLHWMISFNETSSGVNFAVKVRPRAKKNAISGEVGDALKLSLTAPPVDGKANHACIEFFANVLKVPRSSVTIAAGQTSRNKVIRVIGLTAQQIRERLHVAV